MKLLFLLVLIPFICTDVLGQKSVTITSNVGQIIKDGELYYQGVKISTKEATYYNNFVLAYNEGFATQGISNESLVAKKIDAYIIKLNPITRPVIGPNAQKIKLLPNIVPNNSLKFEGSEYSESIGTHMKAWGYDIVGLDQSAFKNKEKNASIAISVEVANYAIEVKNKSNVLSYTVSILVNWVVYDTEENKVLLKTSTGGYSGSIFGEDKEKETNAAMKDAAMGLIIDQTFIKIISNEPPVVKEDKTFLDTLFINDITATEYSSENKLLKTTVESTVSLKTKNGVYAGFIVDHRGYIISTCPPTQDSNATKIVFSSGLRLPATFIAENKKNGTTIYKVPGTGYTALPICKTITQVDVEIIFIGCDQKTQPNQTLTKNKTKEIITSNNINYIVSDPTSTPLNCGGIIINDKGEVLGIETNQGSSKLKSEKKITAIPILDVLDGLKLKIE